MVPTVIITDKVALSSDLKPKIQMIVRELFPAETFADENIFCITKKDDSVLKYVVSRRDFARRLAQATVLLWSWEVRIIRSERRRK